MKTVEYKMGSVIFKQGDVSNVMYKIVKGKVQITAKIQKGDTQELAVLKAGQYFGEMGIIESEVRSANAIADTDVELLEIDAASFERFVVQNPGDAVAMMKNLSGNLRKTTKDYKDASKTVELYIDEEKDTKKKSESIWSKLKNLITNTKESFSDSGDVSINKKNFMPGEIIFKNGQKADKAYKIILGDVSIVSDYGKSSEKELSVLSKGSIFGEMGIIEETNRSATAVAKTQVELYPFSNSSFEEYIERYPKDALLVLRNLSRNLRNTTVNYLEACKVISELVAQGGEDISNKSVWGKLVYYADVYDSYSMPENSWVNYYNNGMFMY